MDQKGKTDSNEERRTKYDRREKNYYGHVYLERRSHEERRIKMEHDSELADQELRYSIRY